MSGLLDSMGDFAKGVGEGAWDGAKGMAEGVSSLAKGGYALATSADARKRAWETAVKDANAAGQFAETAVTDPSKAASQVGDAVSSTWGKLSTAYQQAAADGHGAEFIGKAFGQGAVLAGTAFIPGGAEAEAVGALGDAGRIAELAGDAGKAADVVGDASKVADVTGATGAKEAETVFEAPGSLGDIEAPRTPGLGDSASMSEMLQSGAVPGSKGVQLTDKVSDPAQLYGDMFKLSQKNGVEYAMTRENGDLLLRSGAADKVRVPLSADPIAHTHPFDPETELPQEMPSRADVNALNRRWERNPDGPRPASDIVWGSEPNQVTRYHATGIDQIADPTKGGLKPRRTW